MKDEKEIYHVCRECGISANVLTCFKKFGQRPNELAYICSTFHKAVCDVCGLEKLCTEPRDYFYPDFSLLTKVTFKK